MIDGQRTTERDRLDDLITMRDCLLGYLARGESLQTAIRELDAAIKTRSLREKRERAA